MTTQKIQFDRTSPQTSKSRSVRISPQLNFSNPTQKGFTLIELLVVISIIALLSTVVLAALGDARAKARNTAKNESIRQYITALELYRSNNPLYPAFGNGVGSVNTTTYACIGYAAGENSCAGTASIDGDTNLNNSLRTFFGNTVPKDNTNIQAGAFGNLKGILYACRTSSDCGKYNIIWSIEGISQKCGSGRILTKNIGGTTRCIYEN